MTEKTCSDKEIVVEAFLDIEGVFDNTPHNIISIKLSSKTVNKTVFRWIIPMPYTRQIQANLVDKTMSVNIKLECPQGVLIMVTIVFPGSRRSSRYTNYTVGGLSHRRMLTELLLAGQILEDNNGYLSARTE